MEIRKEYKIDERLPAKSVEALIKKVSKGHQLIGEMGSPNISELTDFGKKMERVTTVEPSNAAVLSTLEVISENGVTKTLIVTGRPYGPHGEYLQELLSKDTVELGMRALSNISGQIFDIVTFDIINKQFR